ncbi:MAG: hypothetical protein WC898_02410 [Candidatus Paceibacterota bacterium]|jgi:hypothetical protein
MSFLTELKAGTDHKKVIKYPGTEKTIEIHLLSEFDEQNAEFAASALFQLKNIAVGMHNIDLYQSEITLQKLFLACRDTDGKTSLASSIEEFKQNLLPHDRNVLVEEFFSLSDRYNPSVESMSQTDFDVFVADVKKKPQQTIGNISNLTLLKRLALALAEPTSPAANGSISTP